MRRNTKLFNWNLKSVINRRANEYVNCTNTWCFIANNRLKLGVNKANNIKHPTVKPIQLIERLLDLTTKEDMLVLDPFIGSGTTALACIKNNRNYIGIELDKGYCDICNERIMIEKEQLKLF